MMTLGYEVGSGAIVEIPLRHMAVTGQTQMSGKTTTLEALAHRSGETVLTFITKRGETAFKDAERVQPYFRDRADWMFVTSIIDATLQEKNKFLRPWIMKISRTTKTLAEVQERVREALHTAKGLNEGVYTQLDAYLDLIVPEIRKAKLADRLSLAKHSVNVMDVSGFDTPMQMLFVQSAIDWINAGERETTVVIPEAWEFIPEGKGSPVKASAIALARKGAALGNHIWVDSQDMAGVDKTILRGCTVWLIGVQREANEIKRNLANIPAGIAKPKAADVALLERGQFFVCHGRTATKTYVMPRWMPSLEAMAIAQGHRSVPAPKKQEVEEAVDKAEAQRIQEENANLKQDNLVLREKVEKLERDIATMMVKDAPVRVVPGKARGTAEAPPAKREYVLGETFDNEALYAAFKDRLVKEAPSLIRLLITKPEIEVQVQRHKIELDDSSYRGRIAKLLADGFYDAGTTCNSTRTELRRTGADVNTANIGRVLDEYTAKGFLVREGGGYKAVEGMKVNIVEAR